MRAGSYNLNSLMNAQTESLTLAGPAGPIEALLDETGTPRHVARPAQRRGAAAQPAAPA